MQAALDRLDDVATKTVQSFEQTIARELRQSVKEGWTSKDELTQLAQQAYTEIVRQLKHQAPGRPDPGHANFRKFGILRGRPDGSANPDHVRLYIHQGGKGEIGKWQN